MEQDRPEEVQHAEDGTEPEESTGTPVVEETPPKWKWMPIAQTGYIFAGVILPIICFLLPERAGFPLPHADWQSGDLAVYCSLLFSQESCLPFYPFVLYSMASMTCMVIRPQRYSQRFLTRLGIYTGFVLAIQYFILLGMPSFFIGFVLSPILALLLCGSAWLIIWLISCPRAGGMSITLTVMGVFAILTLGDAFFPPFYFMTPLVCSTTWASIAYSMMSWRLLRRNRHEPWQFSLAQLFVFVTWIAAYCSAWRMSVMLMLAD